MNTIRAKIADYRPSFLLLKSSTDLGYRALTMKDYDKAAWHLEFEVENEPDQPEPRLYLGQVYEETGKSDQAADMYRSAAKLDSGVLVERNPAVQGRPVTEVAAERLAALEGSHQVAAIQEQMEVPNTPPLAIPVAAEPVPAEVPNTVFIPAQPPAVTTAVHLASYKRRGNADRGWNVLTGKHRELRSFEPAIIETDLGPKKGIYYRLLADGIGSRDQARNLCRSLKSQGHDWCQIGEISH